MIWFIPYLNIGRPSLIDYWSLMSYMNAKNSNSRVAKTILTSTEIVSYVSNQILAESFEDKLSFGSTYLTTIFWYKKTTLMSWSFTFFSRIYILSHLWMVDKRQVSYDNSLPPSAWKTYLKYHMINFCNDSFVIDVLLGTDSK